MRAQTGVVMLLALSGAIVLSGCASADSACANSFEEAALAVDQVATADFSCDSDFGHPSQNGTITLSIDDVEAAPLVIDEVYREFASSGDLEDAWIPHASFFVEGVDKSDPGNLLDDSELGIRDDPSVGALRDHYDIHPSGTG